MKKGRACLVLLLALVFGGALAACGPEESSDAAKNVSALIEEIGAVSELTLDAKDEVEAARTAYDALSEDDKADVANYADLQAAEAELATLEEIDALTLAITSEASMKSGAEYVPTLTGYEYGDVQTSVLWSVADVGATGASVSAEGSVVAYGIGRFTLIATVSYEGHNIEKQTAITVEVDGYTVSGSVVFPENNGDLASQASVRSASGIVGQVVVGEDGSATFTVGVPQGDTTLIFSAPAFEEVTLELKDVAADNDNVGTAEFSDYRFTDGGTWTPAAERYSVQEGTVTVTAVSLDEHAAIAFADVESTQVYLQATISDIRVGYTDNSFDVGFAPILTAGNSYAYEIRQNYTGKAYEKAIARLQGSGSNLWVEWKNGTSNVVFTDTNGAWLGKDVPANEQGLFEGLTVTLTMIRDGRNVYVWTQLPGEEAIYHGVDVLAEEYAEYEAGFGLYSRGGNGATFSDISFSTDSDFIAEKLSCAVTVNAETQDGENGTVALVDASGEAVTEARYGQELTLVVTPNESTQSKMYYISAATLNGDDILGQLEPQEDGSYRYTFVVRGAVTVNVSVISEERKTVSGTVTVPSGNENLLAQGTVGADGVIPAEISAEGEYTLVVPATTEKIVVTVPGFRKEVALDSAQKENETLDVTLTAADYALEANSATWPTADGRFTYSDGELTISHTTENTYAAVAFDGISSAKVMMQATISGIVHGYAADDVKTFDIGFAPIITSGAQSYAYELRQWINFGAGDSAIARMKGVWAEWTNGIGADTMVFPLTDGKWFRGEQTPEDGRFNVVVTLTMVRDGNDIHIWTQLEGGELIYHGCDTLADEYIDLLAGFGFFSRGGTGATFSDISFSTDSDVIAGWLNPVLTLNAQTGENNANGTVALTDAEGEPIASGESVPVGSEVTVTVTPAVNTDTEVYSITNFTVGGVNIPVESLTQQEGSYLYTFTVGTDTQINVTVSVAQSVKVTGTVTVPAGNENLLGSGTVAAGTNSGKIGADGKFEIIVSEDTTELIVSLPGFFKKVSVVLPDGENEYAIESPVALAAADYVFETAYVTGGATYEKNDDGSLTLARSANDAMNAVVFSGVSADTFMISMTVGEIYTRIGANTHFDIGFSMWLPSERMLAYEARESGVIARLCDPGWSWLNGTANKIPGISDWENTVSKPNAETGLFEGLEIEMTMVRKGTTIYLWINGVYLGSTEDAAQFLSAEDGVSFGVYTRAGVGATFSDITFSTDNSAVDAYLAENIPAEE